MDITTSPTIDAFMGVADGNAACAVIGAATVAALSSAVVGRLNPALYQGQITSLSQSIPAAGTAGRWYYSTVAGTLTDSDAGSAVIAVGGVLLDNGSAWLPQPALSTTPQRANYFPDPEFRNLASRVGVVALGNERIRCAVVTSAALQDWTITLADTGLAVGDTLCAYFRAMSTAGSANSLNCVVIFLDSGGGIISYHNIQNGSVGANVWADIRHTLVIPALTVSVVIRVQQVAGIVYVQTIQVTKDQFSTPGYQAAVSLSGGVKNDTVTNFASGILESLPLSLGLKAIAGKRLISGAGTSSVAIPVPGTWAAGQKIWVGATVRDLNGLGVNIQIRAENSGGSSLGTGVAATSASAAWQRIIVNECYFLPSTTAAISILYSGASGSNYEITDLEVYTEDPHNLRPSFGNASPSSLIADTKVVYLGKSGYSNGSGPFGNITSASDSNLGNSQYPFATMQKCVNALGGNGTVVIYNFTGYEISASDLAFTAGTARNLKVHVFGNDAVIRGGTLLTSITKTSGRTKIYQAPLASIPATCPFIFEDGAAETGTLIPSDEHDPQQQGRTYRLPSTYRIRKTTATVLADALTEIDAASVPKYFYDGATVYFSHTGGAASPTNGIYISGNQPAGWADLQSLELSNLRVRYMPLPLPKQVGNFNATAVIRGCSVIGQPADPNFPRNVVAYSTEWAASLDDGCGSYSGDHTYIDCWMHDNDQDGHSNHFGGVHTLINCLIEYNGGAGSIPAIGGSAVWNNCKSRKNAIGGTKQGGFVALEAGSYGIANNCVSVGDKNGYATANGGKMECNNCIAISPVERGYGGGAATIVRNCRQVSEAVASVATAQNGTLVT